MTTLSRTNQTIIDSIMTDNGYNLESALYEVQEVPESWVNSLQFEKAFDEMSNKECREIIKLIEGYLKENYS